MSLLRRLPLKYRLPLIHGVIWNLARLRSVHWPKAMPADVIAPGPLIVSGFHKESSGIAQGAKDIFTAFTAADITATAHDIRPAFSHFLRTSATFPTDLPGGVWLMPINPSEIIIALMAYPVASWANRYRIGYWAWETTRAPHTWVWTAQFLHEVWVPSQFVFDAVKAAFEAAGRSDLTYKLRIMLHPLPDFTAFAPDRARFGLQDDLCEVLCLFDMNSAPVRKNPWAALEAWVRAFPDTATGARLHLKVQNLDDDPRVRQRLTSLIGDRSDVKLFDQRLSDTDMRTYIASFDAMISLHRSEGFGLTLAEAMGMNLAVIATGWSGNMAFMTAENSYLIPPEALIPVEDPFSGIYGGLFGRRDTRQLWAEPDITAAATALRDLVGSPDVRQKKIIRARQEIYPCLNTIWTRQALADLPFWRYLTQ
jgi:glycosyltransferase involved in cell wall biosynthesis